MNKSIIGTKISVYIWAGGEGADDRVETIGYCKDMPIDVLRKIIKSHSIYSYIGVRISNKYIIGGVVISAVYKDSIRGCDITGRIEDLYKYIRNFKCDKFDLEDCRDQLLRHHKNVYNDKSIDEFNSVLDGIEKENKNDGE